VANFSVLTTNDLHAATPPHVNLSLSAIASDLLCRKTKCRKQNRWDESAQVTSPRTLDRRNEDRPHTSATTRRASNPKMVRTLAKRSSALRRRRSRLVQKKYYVLEMLPYPSGVLHMGHVTPTIPSADALARYMWMNGYNVLHPMGLGFLGCPRKTPLSRTTLRRAVTLWQHSQDEAQMKRPGFAYDWSREVTTCLPITTAGISGFFLKSTKRVWPIAKNSRVNWCPKCRHGARQ